MQPVIAAADEMLESTHATDMAGAGGSKTQTLVCVLAYLTRYDWDVIEDPSKTVEAKVDRIKYRFGRVGMRHACPQTRKMVAAAIVLLHWGLDKLPTYHRIYNLTFEFASAILNVKSPWAFDYILVYPTSPFELPTAVFQSAYDVDDQPITVELGQPTCVANDHVPPLRWGNKLHVSERARGICCDTGGYGPSRAKGRHAAGPAQANMASTSGALVPYDAHSPNVLRNVPTIDMHALMGETRGNHHIDVVQQLRDLLRAAAGGSGVPPPETPTPPKVTHKDLDDTTTSLDQLKRAVCKGPTAKGRTFGSYEAIDDKPKPTCAPVTDKSHDDMADTEHPYIGSCDGARDVAPTKKACVHVTPPRAKPSSSPSVPSEPHASSRVLS
jgi:hypothetical protein